jgi:hypothetical protein
VCAFNRGESPEQILEGYPLLGSLAKARGSIASYLDHNAEIDKLGEAKTGVRGEQYSAV